jgi:predicted RNase H-like HicB family nuclease
LGLPAGAVNRRAYDHAPLYRYRGTIAGELAISFPAFPGTVATGSGFAELMTNARDALASVVAAMEEDGERIPESFDASPESPSYNPADYSEPRIVLAAVEVGS